MFNINIELKADPADEKKLGPATISVTFLRGLSILEMKQFHTIIGDLIKICERGELINDDALNLREPGQDVNAEIIVVCKK